jgi:type IX secretion system PorP/SprF family membrane protein
MYHPKLFLCFGLFMLSGVEAFAQQLPLSNQFTINKFSISPAYAGAGERFEIYGMYRNEWLNMPGTPETKTISANGLICKNMGLGGSISSQNAGIFENQSAMASYAYHAKFSGGHTLSFGVGIGLLESRVNIAGAAGQANDPVAANNADVTDMVFDAGFGILYRFKGLSVGIGAPRILTNKIKNENGNTVYMNNTQEVVNLGYKYSFNNDWAIDPVAKVDLVKQTRFDTYYEVAVPVIYKNRFWVSPIYKKTCMAFGIGGIPYNNFIFNYSYEFSSTGIMGESGGTHEITLGWKMGAKKKSDAPSPDRKKPYLDWILK